MKPHSWKSLSLIYVVLLVVSISFIYLGCSNSILPDTTSSPELKQTTPSNSNTPITSQVNKSVIGVSDLPPEAKNTMQLIKNGGPFPYSKDGAIFNNYERLLPSQPSGYYHEYTVITPGAPDRGARRIVAGSNGEYYYTEDHYNTFKLIVE